MLAMMAGEAGVITPISYQTVAANPVGKDLAVFDTENNKLLWKESVAGDIDERIIVIRDQQLYCLVQGVGMVCRDLKTGKVLWTNPDTELQTEFKTPDLKIVKEFLVSLPVLSALPDVLMLRAKWIKNTVALSRKDGTLLWRKPTAGGSYRGLTACAVGDMWLGGGNPMDLKSGSPTKGPNFISSGCGPTTCTPDYLITCFGKVLDIKTNKLIRAEDIKSPCDVGSIVSDGLMITMPSECGCTFEAKGYRALASAGTFTPHTAPAWKDRLKTIDTAEPAPLSVTDADWPTYRHDPQRSAASTATVGNASTILWQWKEPGAVSYATTYAFALGQNLKPDFLPTAPVAANGKVWFGSPDGVVRCLEAATGKELWSFATGAMLFKPPTLWEGRVLVGGGDGQVYCLNAQTGKCLYQVQVAPANRRIFWFGHMISTWPVMTGVAVRDGVAYTIAGYQKENGVHACAFNPKNGELLWENDKAGSAPGLSCNGSVAVADGKLFMPTGCFDAKTGDVRVLNGTFGSETAVFDKWYVQGGRRISESEDTIGKPMGGSGFGIAGIDPKLGGLGLNDAGTSLPAWDAEGMLLPPRNIRGTLMLLPTDKFTTWLTEFPAAKAAFDKAPKDAKPKLVDWPELKTWATDAMLPVAFALTKDQAVIASTDGKAHKATGYLRADGKVQWTVSLPEQPAMNRIAVDRDGRVLISLCDGSIVCLAPAK
jgi:outer membrane protein assembly factor BamB